MSRIIVKNLPNLITEEALTKQFSSKGTVTDVKLKYKNGAFRGFGFVGYDSEEAATAAINDFHNTFVRQNKISVELCEQGKVKIKNVKIQNEESTEDNKDDAEDEESKTDESKVSKMEKVSDLDYLEVLKKTSGAGFDKKETKHKHHFYTIVIKAKTYCKGDKKNKGLTKPKVKAFLKPLSCKSIRIDRKSFLVAFVGFKTEQMMKQALMKDNSFIDGARVSVCQFIEKVNEPKEKSGITPWSVAEQKLKSAEPVAESGIIYMRNLWFSITEEDIQELLKDYGDLVEISLPIDKITRRNKGFATVTFYFPENAVKAMNDLDGIDFKGRCLHILPGMIPEQKENDQNENFKSKKEKEQKAKSSSWHNWNTLFLGPSALIDALSEKTKLSKQQLLSDDGSSSVAVNLAIGEAAIVDEVKKLLEMEGVALSAFNNPNVKRSTTVLLAKNLPAKTSAQELSELFGRYGEVGRVVLPPSGVTAIVEYLNSSEAKKGFRELAYSKYYNGILYLEWAPIDVFTSQYDSSMKVAKNVEKELKEDSTENSTTPDTPEPSTTLYVKNLNFDTSEEQLTAHFETEGKVSTVLIAKKNDLSQGYGFVQYYKKSSATSAVRNLQNTKLDGHNLLIKFSEKTLKDTTSNSRKLYKLNEITSSKIICKNIPFQATVKEIRTLFSKFGDIKTVRLPEKPGSTEHRGFGFIDYISPETAKVAFDALSGSTHLYGRRLVLDWAKDEETVEEIRKRTAEHFISSNNSKSKKLKLFE